MTLKEQLEDPILKEITQVVMAFAQKLSGKKYYPYQVIIGEVMIKHLLAQTQEDITVLLSRQSGKSTIAAEVNAAIMVILPALAEVYGDTYKSIRRFKPNALGAGTGGVRIGVYAPIFEQSQVVFQGVKNILDTDSAKSILKEFGITKEISKGDTVRLSNNSRIACNSASEQSNIESATHDIVMLDEAQDITTKTIAKSIRPMLANTGGNMVYIGTCGNYKWDFYETIQRNTNLELDDKVKRHYEFDYQFCSKYNEHYNKYVGKEIDKYGYDSDFVKQNYRLVWILERGQFCTEDMMFGRGEWGTRGMVDIHRGIVYEDKQSHCCAGLDLGKENDSTVVTIVAIDHKNVIVTPDGIYYKKNVLNWLEIYGDNYESQYWQIIDFLRKYRVDKLCVDATSQGDPVADRLSSYLHNIEVEPVKFGEKQNSEMFKLTQQEIQAGRIKIPYNEEARESHTVKKFVNQMINLEKEYKGQYLKAHHPDIRGAHDDYFSSLVLALYACQNAELPEIEDTSSNLFGRTPLAHNRGSIMLAEMPEIMVS